MLLVSLLVLLLAPQPSPSCSDVEVCRAEALIAHAKKDYEAFHDLAWAAYNKGKKNDPELMLLVARAQSLSGRPGDALVMLERIAALGGSTDAHTSDDFAKVRALARWSEVEEKLTRKAEGTEKTEEKTGGTAELRGAVKGGDAKADAKSPRTKPESPKTEPPKAEPAKPEPTKPEPPKAEPPKTETAKPDPAKAEPPKKEPPKSEVPKTKAEPAKPTDVPASAAPPAASGAKAKRDPREPLKFETLLSPSALAYDAVSRRFIMADRQARRVAVIDENTGQVSTLVGAQGALGDVGGIAIDASRGDLWIVSAGGDGSTLHKMQLISGRVLRAVPLEGVKTRLVALTFMRDSGLVAADEEGTLWRVPPSGKAEKIAALEYVPRALASDPLGRLYVSAGGPRLARFSISPAFRRTGVVELDAGIPTDMPFVVSADRLHVIVRAGSEYEIRSMKLR